MRGARWWTSSSRWWTSSSGHEENQRMMRVGRGVEVGEPKSPNAQGQA